MIEDNRYLVQLDYHVMLNILIHLMKVIFEFRIFQQENFYENKNI